MTYNHSLRLHSNSKQLDKLGTARTGGVVLPAGNRVALSQEGEMPSGIWPSEQCVKSGVEILRCLQEQSDLCGFDEADPPGVFLEWLTLTTGPNFLDRPP